MAKFPCPKCDGNKVIKAFGHVAGGTCFKCGGAGVIEQKSAPRTSKLFSFSFLWTDPTSANFLNGEFCRCFRAKAASLRAAERKAAQYMSNNGSVDFKVEEIAA